MNRQKITKKKIYKTIVSSLVAMSILPSINSIEVSAEENMIPSEEINDENTKKNIIELQNILSAKDSLNVTTVLEMEDSNLSNILNEAIIYHIQENYELAKENYELVLHHQNLSDEYSESIQLLIKLVNEQLIIIEEEYIEPEPSAKDEEVPNEDEASETPATVAITTSASNSADEMYEAVINAPNASSSWTKALEFKETYPEDTRREEAINDAAQRISAMGKANHQNNDLANAIYYYELVLNEEFVNESLKAEFSPFYAQALNNMELMTENEMYTAVIDAPNASSAWESAQVFKNYYSKSNQLEEAFESAGQRIFNMGQASHKSNNFNTAIHYYDLLLDESTISSNMKNKIMYFKKQAEDNSSAITETDLLNQTINAPNASLAWERAQDFKNVYPNSEILLEAFKSAGQRIYNMGISNHKSGNYSLALAYYDLLINESLISESIHPEVEAYYSQALKNQDLATAEDMFKQVINAPNASQAWTAAQEFKATYPNDANLTEAINDAGQRIYSMGRTSHKNSDFSRAIHYYDLLLAETLVAEATINEAKINRAQATNNAAYLDENVMYGNVVNAQSASEAWGLAQELKSLYPNSNRLADAFSSAGQRIYNMGISSHKVNNYSLASTYYEMLINEPLIDESIRTEVGVYNSQASNNNKLETADDMFASVINAPNASTAWSKALEYKELFPNNGKLNEAINNAADRILSMGITEHKNSNYSNALNYYNQLLGESLVNKNLIDSVQLFSDLAKDNEKLLSTSGYYNATLNATSASEAWNISKIGIRVYPNSSYTLDALDKAANRNLKLGRSYQRSGNNSQARIYFNRVNQESKVSESIDTLAKVFLNQLDGNHKPVIYLDAGHGGNDPGASHGGVTEKLLNLNTSEYLKTELENRGYIVVMSRTNDTFLELIDRANGANEITADMFISVHYNSMGGSGVARGIETFIHHTVPGGFGQETNRSNFLLDDPRIDESLRLADSIHSNLIQGTSMNDRGVKGNNFGVLRNTHVPAILLELGFMDNTSELAKIRTSAYQKTAARSIANGVDSYFNNVLN